MLFLNEYDVEEARARYANHPVLGPATETLSNLVEWTNSHSDGWPYWQVPRRAALKLQELIQGESIRSRYDGVRADATAEKLAAALRPIKAFRTKQGADFKIITTKGAV
jgi:hypothetical protein